MLLRCSLLTEREKRVITIFSRYGALSKKGLAEKEEMSWATAVKLVSRLENMGIVQCIGAGPQPETTGKNPLLYDLSDRNPLVIGIDVAYSTTHLILTNLKKTVLAQQTSKTPQKPSLSELQHFLVEQCLKFIHQNLSGNDSLKGVGIGIPLWLAKGEPTPFALLQKALETHCRTRVRIENNVRNYTMYKKWGGKAFSLDNFILITIRNGIGTGIFYRGELLRGIHGMAGELSHLTVVDQGQTCRCGRGGCLETLLNQDVLYQQYVQQIRKEMPLASATDTKADIRKGLADLFSLAKHGNQNAVAIIKQAAYHLAIGVEALLKILDIPDVIIVADFGPDGDALLPYLHAEVSQRLLPGTEMSARYFPLEQLGFAQGAALLILQKYFTRL